MHATERAMTDRLPHPLGQCVSQPRSFAGIQGRENALDRRSDNRRPPQDFFMQASDHLGRRSGPGRVRVPLPPASLANLPGWPSSRTASNG